MGTRQRTPHLIGREEPLRVLFDALDEVTGSAGSLVLVSGEAGMGKTRLLDEFAARVDEAKVARGGCIEGVAYAPWTDALWWVLGTGGLVGVHELPDGVVAQLARLMPQLGVAPTGRNGDQHMLFEAIVQLLAHVAARTKLVLVIDDVHWIDPASRELLRYVAANLRRTPILLVAAYRPEDSAPQRDLIAQLGRLGRHRIALDRLADDAAAAMATYLLGTDEGSLDIEHIARDAGGNPLFVEELVAARDEAVVPETLRDLMSVRFNSLDDDARSLVCTAALIGARVPRAWLVASAGLDTERARVAARGAVDAGLLLTDDDGRGYAFRHALLRQAVLDDLVPDERVALHRAIAEALDGHPERAVGVDSVTELARHWDDAEQAAPALRSMVAAAQHATARYAFDAACEAYERALFWWGAVDEPSTIAGIDHVVLLLEAADAAGLASHINRAAELARAGLDEACSLDLNRCAEVTGRVWAHMWLAGRAPELHEFTTSVLFPVLDSVDPHARAGLLLSHVEHLLRSARPGETRAPAARMIEAIREVTDPALEARVHETMAACYAAYGDVDPADAELDRAVQIARDANDYSTLALMLYNRAAFYSSIPRLAECASLLGEVDELVERYGLRRFLVPARGQRALMMALQGDLAGATTAIASLDELVLESLDAWFRAIGRSRMSFFAGDFDTAFATLEPDAVGSGEPEDPEFIGQIAILRSEALAWRHDLDAARRAVDRGMEAVERQCEIYWFGWLAMAATRVEADAAVAASASNRLDLVEYARARAGATVAKWTEAVAQLLEVHPLAAACSAAIDAEMARLTGGDISSAARMAAEAFDELSMPYYATYFRFREAEATLDASNRPVGVALLQRARGTARTHGFAGLDNAITALARAHQLRIGPGRTSVDGDEPLSVREHEVLRLLVDGKTNPEIAEELCISRRTAAAHVSSVLRKLGATSRVEAVTDAHRRGLI